MNRTEYIHKLQAALTGKIPPSEMAESVAYYEDYFDAQMRSGKSDEEIIKVLGDPRLIANSIIQASKHADETTEDTKATSDYYREDDNENTEKKSFFYWMNDKLPRWIRIILMILLAILIIYLAALFLRAFLPIIIGIFLVVFVIKVFQNWQR